MNLDKFADLLDTFGEDPTNIDKLTPELRYHIVESKHLGTCLKHPLVYQIPFHSWKLANHIYEQKSPRFHEAVDAGEWGKALIWLEKPYRLSYLIVWWRANQMTDDEFRELFAEYYVDAEMPMGLGKRMLLRIFKRLRFVTDMEGKPKWQFFQNPDEEFTVWRGAPPRWKMGISWTRSALEAEKFAHRRNGGRLYQATVNARDVLGIFMNRGETEVIIDPKNLKDFKELPLGNAN